MTWRRAESPLYDKLGFRPDGAVRDITIAGKPIPEMRYALDNIPVEGG
jgi:RimJ/RimL family protein N-acetyltransferase